MSPSENRESWPEAPEQLTLMRLEAPIFPNTGNKKIFSVRPPALAEEVIRDGYCIVVAITPGRDFPTIGVLARLMRQRESEESGVTLTLAPIQRVFLHSVHRMDAEYYTSRWTMVPKDPPNPELWERVVRDCIRVFARSIIEDMTAQTTRFLDALTEKRGNTHVRVLRKIVLQKEKLFRGSEAASPENAETVLDWTVNFLFALLMFLPLVPRGELMRHMNEIISAPSLHARLLKIDLFLNWVRQNCAFFAPVRHPIVERELYPVLLASRVNMCLN